MFCSANFDEEQSNLQEPNCQHKGRLYLILNSHFGPIGPMSDGQDTGITKKKTRFLQHLANLDLSYRNK